MLKRLSQLGGIIWVILAPAGLTQPLAEEYKQALQMRLQPQGYEPASESGTTVDIAAESIRQPDPRIEENQEEREEKLEQEAERGETTFNTKFGIPIQEPGFKPSRAIRCDAIRHLKTPSTYRRLDSYFRPEVLLPEQKNSDFWKRDYFTGDWEKIRTKLYKAGVDIYGCWGFDQLNVIKSNLSNDPVVKTPAPNFKDQQNYVQLYGLDFYSELVNKDWKGAQLHFSFAWPESRPIWLFGNALTPIATQSVHGNFYYDTGTARTNGGTGDSAAEYQGFRVFEMWLQQRYGKKMQNFVRVGNIYPWINFNRTILAAMFNFWTFDEPGSFGTNPNTGRGPIYPTAPLGIQWYQIINDNLELLTQVGAGYYDPTGGTGNRRGLSWYLDKEYGLEGIVQLSYKGGTYSGDKRNYGLPWLVHLGWQFHTGRLYSNYLDINGNPFQNTGLARKELNFNSGIYLTVETMLYREKGSYNQGLTGFFKTTQYFQNYFNLLRNTYVAGLGYEGLIPGRNNDVLMAGIGLANMTDGARLWNINSPSCAQKKGGGCENIGVQYIIEVGYSAKLTPWLFIHPSLQYLVQPYGRTDLGNILSATLSLGISF